MGSLSDNLLKLTEFPFSYSFIGLLALIFSPSGESQDNNQLEFDKVGPLLILMGFVATTLSIWDPIGHAQRGLLLGWSWLCSFMIPFQKPSIYIFPERKKFFITPVYGSSVQAEIPDYVLACLTRSFQRVLNDTVKNHELPEKDFPEIYYRINSLKNQASETTWVVTRN